MAELDVAALRVAIAALQRHVDEEHDRAEGEARMRRGPIPYATWSLAAFDLLEALIGLPARIAALERVADAARAMVRAYYAAEVRGFTDATDAACDAVEDALHDLDNAHLPPDAVERDAP